VQARLQAVRQTIRGVLPQAEERISYRIPTFWQGRNLIHYAAFARHIGLYPGAAAIEAFRDELQTFRHARGSIQFPLQEPLPLALIQRIAAWCAENNAQPVSASPARRGRASAAEAPGRTRR
jgi:uncharacterized protein YdhG (YjbR/CyaY superfamily)